MLPKFTTTNIVFQSETPMITKIHVKMNEFYRELLMTYMKTEYTTQDLDKIDPTNERYFKNLDEIYLGLGVQKQIMSNDFSQELVKDLKERCRNFIIKACVGIRKRYSLNDPVMSAISRLDPDSCLDTTRQESLQELFILVPRIAPKSLEDQQKIDDQWRKLPILKTTLNTDIATDLFWHKVCTYQSIFYLHTCYFLSEKF